MSGVKTHSFQRWNLQHRLQHGFLVLSMLGLIITGFGMKYSYMAWAQTLLKLFGGFHSTLIIHKISAIVLVAVSVYHLFFLAFGWKKYGVSWAMFPTLKDVKDAGQHGAFLLGLRDEPPQYDRYSYLEKFEYLSIFWGMVVMGFSGFALWFPAKAGLLAPRWMLDNLRIIHTNEAFVAMLALFFGHFFSAHFSPLVFPSSSVWYNGKISLAHLYAEHPLEFQRLVEEGKIDAAQAAHIASHPHELRLAGWRRALGVVELVIYSAIFYLLLVTFIPLLLG